MTIKNCAVIINQYCAISTLTWKLQCNFVQFEDCLYLMYYLMLYNMFCIPEASVWVSKYSDCVLQKRKKIDISCLLLWFQYLASTTNLFFLWSANVIISSFQHLIWFWKILQKWTSPTVTIQLEHVLQQKDVPYNDIRCVKQC